MRALLFALVACGPTPQRYTSYPAMATSTGLAQAVVGDWQLTFDDARLAFGAVYFCAAASASPELCETAVGEIAQATTIDLRATHDQPLGETHGLTGEVRSVMFDYGISWTTIQPSPTPSDAAPEGHSAIFRGTATRGAESMTFEAAVDIVALQRGVSAVLGARTRGDVTDATSVLEVSFDPTSWWAGVDMTELQAHGGIITPEMRSYSALVNAMQASFPPTFRWRQ